MSNKIQRNFKCPCGSEKKYKDCCEPQPEKIEPRPAADGGVELPAGVRGNVPFFTSQQKMQTTPTVRVRGAFGKPGRHRHPVDYSTPTDPKFMSRAQRERALSHS